MGDAIALTGQLKSTTTRGGNRQLSHDLRGCLAIIKGYAEVLPGAPSEVREDYCDRIVWACRMMTELVENDLDLDRLQSGQWPIERQEVDVRALVQQCVAGQALIAERKQIALAGELPDRPLRLRVDPVGFCRIVTNMLSNAIKFSPRGTCVRVELRVWARTVEVAVHDQGPGVRAEEASTLFETYVTGSARPTGGERTTGLGLAIVKRLVDAHGAQIRVSSEPGRGATFAVAFPTLQEEGQLPATERRLQVRCGGFERAKRVSHANTPLAAVGQ